MRTQVLDLVLDLVLDQFQHADAVEAFPGFFGVPGGLTKST